MISIGAAALSESLLVQVIFFGLDILMCFHIAES